MSKARISGIIVVMVSAIYACAFFPGGKDEANNGNGSTSEGNGEAQVTATISPTDTPEIATGPELPVPVNEGLASLNSFQMTYVNDVYDSVPDQRSVITFVIAQDQEAEARYNRTETLVTTEDYEVTESNIEEQYVIGNDVCFLRNGQAQFTTMSDSGRQIMDMMTQTLEVNPIIENPEFQGEDIVNGIPVRTYTFEVRSMDAMAEAETEQALGHYAIAQDGDYLVDYRLDMELRTAPQGDEEAEYSISFFDLQLEGINQPQEIAMPETCQTAMSVPSLPSIPGGLP